MIRAIILSLGLLAGCNTTTLQNQPVNAAPPKATVSVSSIFECTEIGPVAKAGTTTTPVKSSDLFPFVLTMVSQKGGPQGFGISNDGTTTIGLGEKQPDGRWVVKNWRSRDGKGLPVTLVTFFPDHNILVSVRTGKNAHVTFGGKCRAVN
ncbi:MAG: hypothetical protein ABJL67_10030 [Sulfitobacter sp.]